MSLRKHEQRAARGESGLSSLQTGDAARRDGAETISAEVQVPVVDTSWDPHQVWLTRVKQPRERSLRMRRQAHAVGEKPLAPDLSDTARLRALTIVR